MYPVEFNIADTHPLEKMVFVYRNNASGILIFTGYIFRDQLLGIVSRRIYLGWNAVYCQQTQIWSSMAWSFSMENSSQ